MLISASRQQLFDLEDKLAELECEQETKLAFSLITNPSNRLHFAKQVKQPGCSGDYCGIFVDGNMIVHERQFKAQLPGETRWFNLARGSLRKDRREILEVEQKLNPPAKNDAVRNRRSLRERARKTLSKAFLSGWIGSPGSEKSNKYLGGTFGNRMSPSSTSKSPSNMNAGRKSPVKGVSLPDIFSPAPTLEERSPTRYSSFRNLGKELEQYNDVWVCENCFRVYVVLDTERRKKESAPVLSKTLKPSTASPTWEKKVIDLAWRKEQWQDTLLPQSWLLDSPIETTDQSVYLERNTPTTIESNMRYQMWDKNMLDD